MHMYIFSRSEKIHIKPLLKIRDVSYISIIDRYKRERKRRKISGESLINQMNRDMGLNLNYQSICKLYYIY